MECSGQVLTDNPCVSPQAVHNIAIETSKSPRSVFPFSQSCVNVSLPASLPRLSVSSPAPATSKLDDWAQAQLQELRSMAASSSPASSQPPQLQQSLTKISSSQKRMEPTIQDTLQQLRSLAGSKGTERRKGERVSIYNMDQDKPISHKENEDAANTLVIKQERE